MLADSRKTDTTMTSVDRLTQLSLHGCTGFIRLIQNCCDYDHACHTQIRQFYNSNKFFPEKARTSTTLTFVGARNYFLINAFDLN